MKILTTEGHLTDVVINGRVAHEGQEWHISGIYPAPVYDDTLILNRRENSGELLCKHNVPVTAVVVFSVFPPEVAPEAW